mgnify:CR=1 FL=1
MVSLIGDSNNINNFSIITPDHVTTIMTYGDFIVRTNDTSASGVRSGIVIVAQNLYIQQHDVYTFTNVAPHGICFGATYNGIYGGNEHNFYMKECKLSGFDKAIYSPGYSCAGTIFEDCTFALCKYGVLIKDTSHCLTIKRTHFDTCYRGLTLIHGGNFCRVDDIHVDTSFHPSFQKFIDEDSRCYFIYTSGGLTLDGVYTEQYTGLNQGYIDTPSTYYLIDYEGNNYAANGGKLIVKNFPCGSPGGYGKWFRGGTFQGDGSLKIDGVPITNNPIRQPNSHAGLWKKGCVDFINCTHGSDNMKKYINIYEGNDRACGYVFDYTDIYCHGLAFTKHPKRGYKGALIYDKEGTWVARHPIYGYNNKKGYLVYERNDYDTNVKTYKGTRIFKDTEKGNTYESTGGYGCHIKGNVTIDNLTNPNLDFTIFLFLYPANSENAPQFIELMDVNASVINKKITTNFELTINKLDYSSYSFGYRVNYDKSLSDNTAINNDIILKMPHGEDEAKIIYGYETEWDSDDIYNYREVDGISLSSETLSMIYGENTNETLSVTYKPTYTTQKGIEWTTSNNKVANVNKDGVVTAVDEGECNIIATCTKNDYAHSAKCKVTVTLPELQSISAVYTQGDSVVYPYTSFDAIKDNLEVTASYANGATRAVTNYSISGTLTAGTSTLTITYKEKIATIDVNVSDAPSNDYVTDNLLVYVQAEDNCIKQQDESSTYVVDKYDGTHYSNTNLSTSMYNGTKKSITFAKENTIKFDNDLVTVGGSYSIEVMARTESLVKQSSTILLGNIHNDNSGYGSVLWCNKNNVLRASYRPSHTENQDLTYTFNTDDIWIYLTLVVDKTENKFKYYVNGNLVNSLDITKYANNSYPLSINTNNYTASHSNYDINTIRLYNKALTDSEVLANYNYQQSLVQ